MIPTFSFSRTPLLHFGIGKISVLPGIAKNFGKRMVIVAGNGSLEANRIWQDVADGSEFPSSEHMLLRFGSEPTVDMVDSAVKKCKAFGPDVVIAAGGGSVMDAGKAISAMVTVKGSVRSYLEGVGSASHPGTKVPLIAIPTTSGTGSEATRNAVISQVGPDGFKRSLRNNNFVPDIAIVDPTLTLSCPPSITAAGGMDCFTQLTESFLSTSAGPYTDALALEGVKAVRFSLMQAFIDGEDITARSGMSFAALTSGICLANSGLGVVHGFASSLGAKYEIPHGIICGTLMAVANEVTVRRLIHSGSDNIALHKYKQLGEIFLDEHGRSDDYYISGFIDYLHHLTYELKLPGLKECGFREEDITAVCSETDNKSNPVKLERDELAEILTRRL